MSRLNPTGGSIMNIIDFLNSVAEDLTPDEIETCHKYLDIQMDEACSHRDEEKRHELDMNTMDIDPNIYVLKFENKGQIHIFEVYGISALNEMNDVSQRLAHLFPRVIIESYSENELTNTMLVVPESRESSWT
jgi:hypothetical protein